MMNYREKQIIRTSWIGIIGNLILAALKIVVGLISGSLAVVGDGIDSAGDVIISFITLITARIISKPPDKKYPYGYARADTVATLGLAFVIFFAGAQLLISTISKFVSGEVTEVPTYLAIAVTAFSIIGKLFLSLIHFKTGKKVDSPMLIANGKNMQNDILLSVGVLIGLLFTFLMNIPVIDKILAFLLSFWIMRVGFKIFLRTIIELMDGVKDPSVYNKIFEAIAKVDGVHNPHKMRIRQIGSYYIVAVDIEVDGNISVSKSHNLGKEVENNIREALGKVYDVLVHIEPLGNEEDEVYGMSEDILSK